MKIFMKEHKVAPKRVVGETRIVAVARAASTSVGKKAAAGSCVWKSTRKHRSQHTSSQMVPISKSRTAAIVSHFPKANLPGSRSVDRYSGERLIRPFKSKVQDEMAASRST
jgi:hypothetical protein